MTARDAETRLRELAHDAVRAECETWRKHVPEGKGSRVAVHSPLCQSARRQLQAYLDLGVFDWGRNAGRARPR